VGAVGVGDRRWRGGVEVGFDGDAGGEVLCLVVGFGETERI
jgi:hypothetical protein